MIKTVKNFASKSGLFLQSIANAASGYTGIAEDHSFAWRKTMRVELASEYKKVLKEANITEEEVDDFFSDKAKTQLFKLDVQ